MSGEKKCSCKATIRRQDDEFGQHWVARVDPCRGEWATCHAYSWAGALKMALNYLYEMCAIGTSATPAAPEPEAPALRSELNAARASVIELRAEGEELRAEVASLERRRVALGADRDQWRLWCRWDDAPGVYPAQATAWLQDVNDAMHQVLADAKRATNPGTVQGVSGPARPSDGGY